MRTAIANLAAVLLICGAGAASAHVPVECAPALQAVEDMSDKAEDKLSEVGITLKHGYRKVQSASNARALIAVLGEYVTVTGQVAEAYSAFLGCVVEGRESDGHLPQPCAETAYPPPDSFRCPSPYVEMIPTADDGIFVRAWHCRETGHTLGLLPEGTCGGGGDRGSFPDWRVPD